MPGTWWRKLSRQRLDHHIISSSICCGITSFLSVPSLTPSDYHLIDNFLSSFTSAIWWGSLIFSNPMPIWALMIQNPLALEFFTFFSYFSFIHAWTFINSLSSKNLFLSIISWVSYLYRHNLSGSTDIHSNPFLFLFMDTKNIWNQIICAPALFLSEVVVDVEDEPSVASELILISKCFSGIFLCVLRSSRILDP